MPAMRNSPTGLVSYQNECHRLSAGSESSGIGYIPSGALRAGNVELNNANANPARHDQLAPRFDNAHPGHTTTTSVGNATSAIGQFEFTSVPAPTSKSTRSRNRNEFTSLPAPTSKSTRSHNRKKGPGHVPRPPNQFLFFRSYYAGSDLAAGVTSQIEVSKRAGLAWAALSDAEKQLFEDLAVEEKARHSQLHPDYNYKPARKVGSAGKAKSGGKKKATSGGEKKKNTSSVSRAAKKKALWSPSSRSSSSTSASSEMDSSPEFKFSSLPVTPRAPRTSQAAAQRAAQNPFCASSSSSSSEPSGSDFEETPSPSPHMGPSFAAGVGLTIVTPEEEEDDFMSTENIPFVDLALTDPVPAEEQKVFEPSFFPPPAPFGAGYGYGFNSSFHPTVMSEAFPVLPQTTEDFICYPDEGVNNLIRQTFPPTPMPVTQTGPELYLPRLDEFSLTADGYMMDSSFMASFSSFSTFNGVGLDAELDPVNRSVAAMDSKYEQWDWDMTNAELDKMPNEFSDFDFESFASRSDAKGKGKQRAD